MYEGYEGEGAYTKKYSTESLAIRLVNLFPARLPLYSFMFIIPLQSAGIKAMPSFISFAIHILSYIGGNVPPLQINISSPGPNTTMVSV